ncbi:hypothetical protein Syun_006130 [Stephania yunnanensis]|uniref:Uncharacterized protein n=1 Tax=Stephania yunnanensis TaxID=152371 RepID=A0AAP0PZ12_9MAGN
MCEHSLAFILFPDDLQPLICHYTCPNLSKREITNLAVYNVCLAATAELHIRDVVVAVVEVLLKHMHSGDQGRAVYSGEAFAVGTKDVLCSLVKYLQASDSRLQPPSNSAEG